MAPHVRTRPHPYNVNLKLALVKVTSSHPHYLHCRLTTTQSSGSGNVLRRWPTEARVQPRNAYNHTCINKPGHNNNNAVAVVHSSIWIKMARDINLPFLCVHFHYFTCVMCLTSLTDYFDDRRAQCRLNLMIVLLPHSH